MTKIAVYTCMTEGHHDLPLVAKPEPGVDYLCFTDGRNRGSSASVASPWRVVPIDFDGEVRHRHSMVKIMPHLFLPTGYDWSIYVDGVDLVGSMADLVSSEGKNNLFALYEHPFRTQLFQEFQACIQAGSASWFRALRQYAAYKMSGYDDSVRLHGCSVLIRKHAQPEVLRFGRLWWHLYFTGVHRDQLSFSYASWCTGFEFHSLGRSDPRYDKKYFSHRSTHGAPVKLKSAMWAAFNRVSLGLLRGIGVNPLAPGRFVAPGLGGVGSQHEHALDGARRLNAMAPHE